MEPEQTREVLDRLRRVETRLTRFLIRCGEDLPSVSRCEWDPSHISGAAVIVPSIHTSLHDILTTVPVAYGGVVAVIHRDKHLFSIAAQRKAAIQEALQAHTS